MSVQNFTVSVSDLYVPPCKKGKDCTDRKTIRHRIEEEKEWSIERGGARY